MLTKTQMKHEIVGQSALSLLASGIRFMEIPQLYPTFDNVFEHAFKECGLDRVYPHVLGLNIRIRKIWLMIQSSIRAMRSRLQGGAGGFMREDVVMSFISLMPLIRIGLRRAMIPGA